MLLEHPNELLADRLAFRLGLGDTFQRCEEPPARIDVDQFDAEVAPERLDHLMALTLAHQPGVDVDAGQLLPDRLMDECCGHRRIDATRQPADHPIGADTLADRGDLFVDHRRHLPVVGDPGTFVEEPGHHRHAMGRVDHLGMELDTVDAAVVVLEHRHRRTGRGRGDREAVRGFGDAVEVAHPHVVFDRSVVGKQQRRTGAGHAGAAVLALHAAADDSAELSADQLGSVTDPEHRNTEVIDARVE